MVDVPVIPLDLIPEQLAREAEASAWRAAEFLEQVRSKINPSGRFIELSPADFLKPDMIQPTWGETVIVGICGLGPMSRDFRPPEVDRRLWDALTAQALRDALDFLEYRIRMYLKPTDRSPGPRLVPGCEDLPIEACPPIMEKLGPCEKFGLIMRRNGLPDPRTGLVFLFPASESAAKGKCEVCALEDCPARKLHSH